MRKMDFFFEGQFLATPGSSRCSRPFTDTIHCQNSGFFKWGRVKGRRGVAEMMLCKQYFFSLGQIFIDCLQLFDQQVLLEKLLSNPDWHSRPKRCEAARCERKICFQQALKFQKRLVIESDMVNILSTYSRALKTPPDGLSRKARIMLLARKALFLS